MGLNQADKTSDHDGLTLLEENSVFSVLRNVKWYLQVITIEYSQDMPACYRYYLLKLASMGTIVSSN